MGGDGEGGQGLLKLGHNVLGEEGTHGPQEDRAEDSLFLMVGKTQSSLSPSGGSQGCSQVWMGVVSVNGSHNSTSAWPAPDQLLQHVPPLHSQPDQGHPALPDHTRLW